MIHYIRDSTDLYEVYVNERGIVSTILRFTGGESTRGVEVTFESLSAHTQNKIVKQLENEYPDTDP